MLVLVRAIKNTQNFTGVLGKKGGLKYQGIVYQFLVVLSDDIRFPDITFDSDVNQYRYMQPFGLKAEDAVCCAVSQ